MDVNADTIRTVVSRAIGELDLLEANVLRVIEQAKFLGIGQAELLGQPLNVLAMTIASFRSLIEGEKEQTVDGAEKLCMLRRRSEVLEKLIEIYLEQTTE